MADEKKPAGKGKKSASASKPSSSKTPSQEKKPASAAVKPASTTRKSGPKTDLAAGEIVNESAKVSINQTAANVTGPGSGRKNPGYGLVSILTLGGIILVLVLLLVYMNISRLSKAGIEQLASRSLGVPVTIEEMIVEPKAKRVTVTGLRIANPEGFEAPYAIEAGSILITGENFSKRLLEFNEIAFIDTTIHLIANEETTNLSALGNRLNKGEKSTGQPSDNGLATQGKGETKIIVHRLLIENARLVPSSSLGEIGIEPVSLPTISGSIGEQEGGISVDRAISEVTGIILEVATKRAVRAGIIKGLSEDASNSIAEKLGIRPEAIESLKQGIKGIFE